MCDEVSHNFNLVDILSCFPDTVSSSLAIGKTKRRYINYLCTQLIVVLGRPLKSVPYVSHGWVLH